MMSLRECSGSCLGRSPARASSGAVSSKIRPFDNAMLMLAMMCRTHRGAAFYRNSADALDARAERAQLGLQTFVAAVEVVDAVDERLPFGHQASDDEAGRGAQVGGHHRRALQLRHAA